MIASMYLCLLSVLSSISLLCNVYSYYFYVFLIIRVFVMHCLSNKNFFFFFMLLLFLLFLLSLWSVRGLSASAGRPLGIIRWRDLCRRLPCPGLGLSDETSVREEMRRASGHKVLGMLRICQQVLQLDESWRAHGQAVC